MLDKPSDVVTSSNRCFRDFKSCRFFIDSEGKKEGLETFTASEDEVEKVNFYSKINILEKILDSECNNFQLIKSEKGLIAYCKVLRRVLTESQAKLCATQWKICPFRDLA